MLHTKSSSGPPSSRRFYAFLFLERCERVSQFLAGCSILASCDVPGTSSSMSSDIAGSVSMIQCWPKKCLNLIIKHKCLVKPFLVVFHKIVLAANYTFSTSLVNDKENI